MLNVGSHHIKIYKIENMVTEFLDFKNRCMAVKDLCSNVVHVLEIRYMSIYWLLAAILILLLPLASHNIGNSYIKYIDFQNMGVAVRIVQLCFMQAEIYIFIVSCFWAAILDFWRLLAQYNTQVSFIQLLDLLNMSSNVHVGMD